MLRYVLLRDGCVKLTSFNELVFCIRRFWGI